MDKCNQFEEWGKNIYMFGGLFDYNYLDPVSALHYFPMPGHLE